MNKILFPSLSLLLITCLYSCQIQTHPQNMQKHEITDMKGRKVSVPASISRIFCADMATTIFAYSIAPDLLVANNAKISEKAKPFITPQFYELPVVGNVFVGRLNLNIEELLKQKPEVLLCPLFTHTQQSDVDAFEKVGRLLSASVVFVALDMDKLAESYTFLGRLLNQYELAKSLAKYCQETQQLADSIKALFKDSISVYIAEGNTGLQTIPSRSTHSKIFEMLGLKNCAQIDEKYGYTNMSINLEQVLSWNPDYMIINNRTRSNKVESFEITNSWKTLKAVQNNHILRVPLDPFNWIGRPPSINRLMGIRWLIHSIYLNTSDTTIEKDIRQFYSMFYHVKMDEKTVKSIAL